VTADASTLADVTGIAAEYARLVAEAARATKRQQDLQAKRPDRGDTEAYAAHKELENAATEAVYEADDAVDAYLGEHPDAVPVYGAARRWLDLGVCTVPVKNDGSKRPIGEWKEYQERLPTSDELFGWHHRGGSGLGIVTGRTGREDGLAIEMFELEARAVSEGILDKFTDALKEAGLWEVWLRITAGFWDVSPSGGFHAYWYCEDVTGNVKLAQREATPEELVIKPGDKYRTLIETRGRGGFTVIAPTPGSYHETGRAWEAQGGPPEALAIITAEQREGIFTCARKFHTAGPIHSRKERAKYEKAATPAKGKTRTKTAAKTAGEASTRPGDLYNESGPDWAELLEPDGWTLFQRDSDGTEHWTRPGKDRGTSATTGNPQHETDKLHVFTSSTAFEPGEAYTKFAYYAITKHDSDFAAAAAQLRKEGYTVKKAAAAGGETVEPVTDSHLASDFAAEALRDRYCWVAGWGWMAYREARNRERRGTRWFRTDDKDMAELARTWLLGTYELASTSDLDKGAMKAWMAQLSEHHVRSVVSLAAGIVKRDMAEFDRHPDLLCCANCVLDLRTGKALDHDPALMLTKTTGVDYVPGATHPDWAKALTALPARVLPWYQIRVGQGTTGYMPPDDLVLLNIGQGENGKTSVLQGVRHGLGDYYVQVPVKALLGDHQEHDTVKMPFRGARIAAVEETPVEGRLNMQMVKQITTPQIQARLMRQDYIEFDTTHATIVNTNHEPGLENADHGSVRRLAAVVWPYRYLKPGLPMVLPTDREGDPGLRDRIIAGAQGQHEAALAWMAAGAQKWYEGGRVMPALPDQVQADTEAWIGRVNLMHAFGTAQLAGDAARCVMSSELYKFFRLVTKDSGNVAWSERTFNARLVEFAAARGWVIEKKKTRHSKASLSQPPVDFPADPPTSYQAWHGLRFRAEADDLADLAALEKPGGEPSS